MVCGVFLKVVVRVLVMIWYLFLLIEEMVYIIMKKVSSSVIRLV